MPSRNTLLNTLSTETLIDSELSLEDKNTLKEMVFHNEVTEFFLKESSNGKINKYYALTDKGIKLVSTIIVDNNFRVSRSR